MKKEKNELKKRLKNGEVVFGTFCSIPSATVIDAIGCAGVDFVVIDTEHGPISIETAENMVRAADVNGMGSIIRVTSNDASLILRALDIGAGGVQIPHVSSKNDAQKAVSCAKYHPLGHRGYTPFTRAGRYSLDAKGYAEKANANTIVVLNVEGKEGLKNLNEIVKTKGVDVVFIGPYDLSHSIGKPGQVEDKEVINSIKNSVKVIKDSGMACGSYSHTLEYMDILIDCGVQYVTYTVDSALVAQSYKQVYERFSRKMKKR